MKQKLLEMLRTAVYAKLATLPFRVANGIKIYLFSILRMQKLNETKKIYVSLFVFVR